MPTLAVMAHYAPHGELGPHVRRQVSALADSVDDLVVVSTADLTTSAESFLRSHARLLRRPNYGYDFFSYKTGLDASGDLARYDEVVICNDTYVGPLQSYSDIFARMADEPVDFWGLTASQRVSPHVQSFFVAFRPWVTASRAFTSLWAEMRPISNRNQIIHRYEVGMSTRLTEAGFRWSTFYRETPEDERRARRRLAWWVARGTPLSPSARTVAQLRTRQREGWNPAIALADVALDGGRLPYVKIDTLRYDPYDLNAAKLLSLCEETYPEAFDGVRTYLETTAAAYPPRKQDELLPPPVPLTQLRRLVEYRRAT